MDPAAWNDLIATDPAGESLGRVEQVHTDPATGQPAFALVRSSSLGGLRHHEVLVPAHRAEERAGTLVFPYSAERVRSAPQVGGRGEPIGREELREVLAHFEGADHTLLGDEDVASVVLNQEELHVGRRVRDFERVRLRKVIVEEEVTVQVRLRREELEVVREPLGDPVPEDERLADDGSVEASVTQVGDDAYAVPDEIILYAEEPVVEARVVPRERVRVSRRVVTDRVTIEEEVRREDVQVDVDPAAAPAPERIP